MPLAAGGEQSSTIIDAGAKWSLVHGSLALSTSLTVERPFFFFPVVPSVMLAMEKKERGIFFLSAAPIPLLDPIAV